MIAVDLVTGNANEFGAKIRSHLMAGDELNYKWSKIALQLLRISPGTINNTTMVSVLCQLAVSELFIDGDLNGEQA